MDESPGKEARPHRRGCLVALGILTVVLGVVFYAVFGVPFDGWSRMNEIRYQNECEATGGSERFCECLIFQLKDAGLRPSEIDRSDGSRAGFLCGMQGNL